MKTVLTPGVVLSKYAWVVGLKSKRGTAMCDALHHVLENEPTQRRPMKLQTDQGKEFYNQHVKRLLDQYGIHHYSTRGNPKRLLPSGSIVRSRNSHDHPQHSEVPGHLTRALGLLQPTHSFQHQHGTGQLEPSQRRGGLVMVVQAHSTLEPLQLSTGRFRENF